MKYLICLLALATLAPIARVGIAAYPPQASAESLDALLRDVWAQGADKTYELYMGKKVVPMSAAAAEEFPRKMLEIAHDPGVGAIILQKEKSEGYPVDHLPQVDAFRDAYFVHFMRADFRNQQVQERIYINVYPDHAAEVMAYVVHECLKPEHGVMEAKVATPSGLPSRADSIV